MSLSERGIIATALEMAARYKVFSRNVAFVFRQSDSFAFLSRRDFNLCDALSDIFHQIYRVHLGALSREIILKYYERMPVAKRERTEQF